MNHPPARFNKETNTIEISKKAIEDWENSESYLYFCWREVVHLMMGGISAEEIKQKNMQMWECAGKYAASLPKR